MGEDTDAAPTLNHHGFLPDHNYVTDGKKKEAEPWKSVSDWGALEAFVCDREWMPNSGSKQD